MTSKFCGVVRNDRQLASWVSYFGLTKVIWEGMVCVIQSVTWTNTDTRHRPQWGSIQPQTC